MPLNLDAIGVESEPIERSWTSKDALLYALGVGAGVADPTGFELDFTTENSSGIDQKVLPTFATIIGGGSGFRSIGQFNLAMLVHGGQGITLHGPLPVDGRIRTTGRIASIYDKGNAAVVILESKSVDAETESLLMETKSSLFIRGEGGFGGDPGPSTRWDGPPGRKPDEVVTYETRRDQALLYRLSGDRNPLHSDPEFAKTAGFPTPILHGLCTYGFTGRALLHTLCSSDPARFKMMDARFSKPVFPGDSLTVKIWVDDDEAVFQTETQRGETVIDQGRFLFWRVP
jgi:acyl dehydratase